MNINFLRNKKWNLQKDIGPPVLGTERAGDKNKKKSDTHKIAQPKINSNQNRTGRAIQHNGNGTLRFWQWWGYALSLFTRLKGVIMNDLIMPHCLESELGLLNTCFYPGGFERVIEIVEPDDFYSDGGRLIFAKMVAFHRAGLEPTLFQVDKGFQDHQNYINIRSILDTLLPFTAEDATHYAKIVKGLSNRRKAIKQAYATYLDLHDPAFPFSSDALQPVMVGGVHG